jgi:cytochrome b
MARPLLDGERRDGVARRGGRSNDNVMSKADDKTAGSDGRLPGVETGRRAGADAGAKVRVWNVVIRLFHWSLVAAFFISYFGNDSFFIHNNAGYVVLALVVLRIPWGIFGPRNDRFAEFVRGPTSVRRYLAGLLLGRPERYLGHNPAGAVMIVLLLVTLFVVTISGVLMTTDRYWGNAFVEDVHYYSSDVVLVLIGLHVLGVLVSSILHKENLLLAMITGRKRT